jgi:hypothetical protein
MLSALTKMHLDHPHGWRINGSIQHTSLSSRPNLKGGKE